jgi:DNA-binding MarR family transcriptional regulator
MVQQGDNPAVSLSTQDVRDEDVDVTFLVWLISRATADLLDSTLAPAGLNSDEFAVYSVLTSVETITPTELARWMAAPPTTVSSYVKRFEARGHVEREPNPVDRRSYRIKMTPAGRQAHRTAAMLFTPIKTRVEAALGPREDGVRESLLALRVAVDEIRNSAAAEAV